MNSGENPQHDFPKLRGGGGQRPFGTFPKIHLFLKGQASLKLVNLRMRTISLIGETVITFKL